MRSVSTSLCLLSTPWWRDSLLAGAKEGKRKRKKHELFPEYLFSPSLNHLGFVVYTRLPAPQKGSWNPFLPFEPVLSWKKKEQDSSRRALPKLFILSWRAHHSGCRKEKEKREWWALLPWQVWNPSFGCGWYLMIQRKYCPFFKADLANCVMFILRHWKKPKKKGGWGEIPSFAMISSHPAPPGLITLIFSCVTTVLWLHRSDQTSKKKKRNSSHNIWL